MTWNCRTDEVAGGRGIRFQLEHDSHAATFHEVVCAWKSDEGFRQAFNQWLADLSFKAFRWETPAVTANTLSRTFECVVLDSPGLARHLDENAFSEHFSETDDVVEFANLSGDAVLIVPCPRGSALAYGHLAAFVRDAPPTQQDRLWQCVGEALERRIGAKPVWLSTAGAGVSWLHVRLDDRPKYYGFDQYRAVPA